MINNRERSVGYENNFNYGDYLTPTGLKLISPREQDIDKFNKNLGFRIVESMVDEGLSKDNAGRLAYLCLMTANLERELLERQLMLTPNIHVQSYLVGSKDTLQRIASGKAFMADYSAHGYHNIHLKTSGLPKNGYVSVHLNERVHDEEEYQWFSVETSLRFHEVNQYPDKHKAVSTLLANWQGELINPEYLPGRSGVSKQYPTFSIRSEGNITTLETYRDMFKIFQQLAKGHKKSSFFDLLRGK